MIAHHARKCVFVVINHEMRMCIEGHVYICVECGRDPAIVLFAAFCIKLRRGPFVARINKET